jgi:hypothetical protein
MEELNRTSMTIRYIRSKEYRSYLQAEASEAAFYKMMVLKKKQVVFATDLTRLDNGNHVVDTLTLENEYKSKNDKCTKEKAVQILAGILEALS